MSKFSPGGGSKTSFSRLSSPSGFAAQRIPPRHVCQSVGKPYLPLIRNDPYKPPLANQNVGCYFKKKTKIWNLDVLVDSNQVFLGRGVIFELGQSHTPNPSWDIELDMLGLYCLIFSQLFERTLQHHLVKLSKYELQHLHYRWTFVNQVLGSLSMFIPVCIYSIHLSWPCRISSMNTTTTRYHHKLF